MSAVAATEAFLADLQQQFKIEREIVQQLRSPYMLEEIAEIAGISPPVSASDAVIAMMESDSAVEAVLRREDATEAVLRRDDAVNWLYDGDAVSMKPWSK